MGGNYPTGVGVIFVIVCPIGFGECFPVEGVDVVGMGSAVFPNVTGIGFFAAGAVGEEEVVLLAKGIEFTAEGILPGDVVATIFITLDVFAGTRQFAVFFNAGKFATGIADEGKLFIRFSVNVIQFAVEIPIIVDGVIEFGKNIRLFVFFAIPVGAEIGFCRQFEVKAVTHRHAVEIWRFLCRLVHAAKGEGGAVAEVGFQHAVEGTVVTCMFFLVVFIAAGNANDAPARGLVGVRLPERKIYLTLSGMVLWMVRPSGGGS